MKPIAHRYRVDCINTDPGVWPPSRATHPIQSTTLARIVAGKGRANGSDPRVPIGCETREGYPSA